MASKLYLHATNVHQGGGRFLLDSLIQALPSTKQAVLLLDYRFPLPDGMAPSAEVRRVSPSILQRFRAERWLARQTTSDDVVLCFGNLPPLFRCSGHTVVFIQNRYLLDRVSLGGFPARGCLRIAMERLWLSCKLANADEVVVQTPSMRNLLEVRSKGRVRVHVWPFTANQISYTRKMQAGDIQRETQCDFVFVASGETHKNHKVLVEAWCLLAKQGVFPSLKLTLDRTHFPELCSWIEQRVSQYRLRVKNVGNLNHDQVKKLYRQVRALIFPSSLESFGLPLVEARQAGLAVLAPELDYVRDVLDPEQTFDPSSSCSIARAVKRFIGKSEPALPLLEAADFLDRVIRTQEHTNANQRV